MNQNESTLDHSKIAEALGSHPRELSAAEINKLHAKGNVDSAGYNLSPTESRIAALEEQVRFLSNVRAELMDEIAKLREAIKVHNAKMLAMPSLGLSRPSTPEEGMRFLATWFDAMYPNDPDTQVQDDLRGWADEIARLRDGCQKLSRAMSRIDYAVGDANEMGVSLYDTDCDQDRVARRVEQEIARLRTIAYRQVENSKGITAEAAAKEGCGDIVAAPNVNGS